jgi:hypothetical protein
MKLIYCPFCHDVFRLRDLLRTCDCGKSSGKYTNGARAVYMGYAVPLGILNHSLRHAAIHQDERERRVIEAFVMPREADNFRFEPGKPPALPNLPAAEEED